MGFYQRTFLCGAVLALATGLNGCKLIGLGSTTSSEPGDEESSSEAIEHAAATYDVINICYDLTGIDHERLADIGRACTDLKRKLDDCSGGKVAVHRIDNPKADEISDRIKGLGLAPANKKVVIVMGHGGLDRDKDNFIGYGEQKSQETVCHRDVISSIQQVDADMPIWMSTCQSRTPGIEGCVGFSCRTDESSYTIDASGYYLEASVHALTDSICKSGDYAATDWNQDGNIGGKEWFSNNKELRTTYVKPGSDEERSLLDRAVVQSRERKVCMAYWDCAVSGFEGMTSVEYHGAQGDGCGETAAEAEQKALSDARGNPRSYLYIDWQTAQGASVPTVIKNARDFPRSLGVEARFYPIDLNSSMTTRDYVLNRCTPVFEIQIALETLKAQFDNLSQTPDYHTFILPLPK